jgi:hypothetical protein
VEEMFAKGIIVDLREPEYCEGILKTEKGGVIQGPDMRIQARKIIYTRKVEDGKPILTVEAEGDLLLEFDKYVFVGSRLEYDFQQRTGVIYNGRTALEPWYFGGDAIYLCPNGEYFIEDGFATTSENYLQDWQIVIERALITCDYLLRAKNVKFRILDHTVFYLPSFKANLNSIFDSPIRYSLKWGGRLGTRFVMIYELFSWRRLQTFMRVDYRIKRGFGLGFETYCRSEDRKENLETTNYVAQDSSIVHPHENIRYRFQGIYNNLLLDDRLRINLSWDKLSDKDMPTDYDDRGLTLETAGLTQLHMRYAAPAYVTNFITRVRVNPFQSLKQELPTLETRWRPINIGSTGIISDLSTSASFLDFKYSNGVEHVHDYRSSRFEATQNFYRPLYLGPITMTPKVGGTALFYGESPSHKPRWASFGQFGCECNTRLHRYYGESRKHVIVPYINYTYLTHPTTAPNEHFIFDIDDGWYRLNMFRFGVQNNYYKKNEAGLINRYLYTEFYAYAFCNTKTIPAAVPKLYSYFSFHTLPTLNHSLETAWDIQRNRLDHFNFRTEWTLSPDMAVSAEFRFRDPFDWRKVDHTNFILDSFRPIRELVHSALSDRRDTLLLHFFYRINPNWAVEFQSRQGWNRRFEPSYNEFEIDILTTFRSAWNLRFYYRHREEDDRMAINLSVGLSRPDQKTCETVPFIQF